MGAWMICPETRRISFLVREAKPYGNKVLPSAPPHEALCRTMCSEQNMIDSNSCWIWRTKPNAQSWR